MVMSFTRYLWSLCEHLGHKTVNMQKELTGILQNISKDIEYMYNFDRWNMEMKIILTVLNFHFHSKDDCPEMKYYSEKHLRFAYALPLTDWTQAFAFQGRNASSLKLCLLSSLFFPILATSWKLNTPEVSSFVFPCLLAEPKFTYLTPVTYINTNYNLDRWQRNAIPV